MTLELNLVKSKTIDTKMARSISRSRYEVSNDTEVLDVIPKFIAENISTFTAALSDQRLVGQLQSLTNLTITDFKCLRYILASSGVDIWAWYVRTDEINPDDVSESTFEYNVLDTSLGSFIPMCTRFIQTSTDNSLVKLYTDINDAFGLFQGSLFAGIKNPIMNMVIAMKNDEQALGTVSSLKTTYVNSILEFLGKDIKVLSI